MDGFAFVRCTCFEEHRLIGCPVPYESLYVDGDGWLWSTVFDAPGALENDEYLRWNVRPCEHPEGALFKASLTSSSVCSEFKEAFSRAGARPHGHVCDGYCLASDAAKARSAAVEMARRLPGDERRAFEESEASYEREGLWDCGRRYDHIALTYVRKLGVIGQNVYPRSTHRA